MVLFTRLSGWIVGPILIAVFVGKWLDKKYGTGPWLFLATVGVAFTISMIGIVQDTMKEIKKIEREAKEKKEEDKDKK